MELSLDDALKELEASINIKEAKKDSRELSSRYLKNFSQGRPLVKKDNEALVYSSIRMRATYAASSFALNKINDTSIKSVLDVGMGSGAATIAVLKLFNEAQIDAIEIEKSMQDVARTIIGKINNEYLQKVNFINCDALNYKIDKKYDLIIASYFFNELKQEDRNALFRKLIASTNKYLVIVEPGTPNNHRELMEIKEIAKDYNINLISPCKMSNCPLLEGDDWCHFLVRINRSTIHKTLKGGALGYEDEKFTYLVFAKHDNNDAKQNIIIRRPEYLKSRVKIKTCSYNGVQTNIITKSEKDRYKTIKKLEIGDEF